MKLYNLLHFMGGISVVSDCSEVALGDVDGPGVLAGIRFIVASGSMPCH